MASDNGVLSYFWSIPKTFYNISLFMVQLLPYSPLFWIMSQWNGQNVITISKVWTRP